MILTKNEILKLIKKKEIIIAPFKEENVGPASIDLTLGRGFRVYTKKNRIEVKEGADYTDYTELSMADTVILGPGDFVLGISVEKITLPPNLCGILTGRSRFARLGLAIHATASLVQPGVSNRQVFEITNLSNNDLVLKAGTKICQMMLVKTQGKATYAGKYAKQEKV